MSDGGRGPPAPAPRPPRRPRRAVVRRRPAAARPRTVTCPTTGAPGGGGSGLKFELIARPVGGRDDFVARLPRLIVGGRPLAIVDDGRRETRDRRPSRSAPSSRRDDSATPRRSSGVRPCVSSFALMSAPRSSSALTASALPACGGEVERLHAGGGDRLRLAAGLEETRDDRARGLSSWRGAAACRRRRASAPRSSRRRRAARPASSRSPLSAAQCSAVMPSPWAALTSAPPRSSVRTSRCRPRIAAAATGASAARRPSDARLRR